MGGYSDPSESEANSPYSSYSAPTAAEGASPVDAPYSPGPASATSDYWSNPANTNAGREAAAMANTQSNPTNPSPSLIDPSLPGAAAANMMMSAIAEARSGPSTYTDQRTGEVFANQQIAYDLGRTPLLTAGGRTDPYVQGLAAQTTPAAQARYMQRNDDPYAGAKIGIPSGVSQPDASAQYLNRPEIYAVTDRAQLALMATGMTQYQAAESLRVQAQNMGNRSQERYYDTLGMQAWTSQTGKSAAYHTWSADTNLPQKANLYEYSADLLTYVMKGYPTQDKEKFSPVNYEVLNLAGGKGQQAYVWTNDKYDLRFAMDVVARVEKSGELGPYGQLKSYSSGYGYLDIGFQQGIAAKVDAGRAIPEGVSWSVWGATQDKGIFIPSVQQNTAKASVAQSNPTYGGVTFTSIALLGKGAAPISPSQVAASMEAAGYTGAIGAAVANVKGEQPSQPELLDLMVMATGGMIQNRFSKPADYIANSIPNILSARPITHPDQVTNETQRNAILSPITNQIELSRSTINNFFNTGLTPAPQGYGGFGVMAANEGTLINSDYSSLTSIESGMNYGMIPKPFISSSAVSTPSIFEQARSTLVGKEIIAGASDYVASLPKPFTSVGTTYEPASGKIYGYDIPLLSPVAAFFQQGKTTTSKDFVSALPEVTTFKGSTYAPVAGGIERTDTYETIGGTTTTTNTLERSTPSAFETLIAPYRAAEKSIGEAIPISTEQGEAALRIAQTGNFLTTPQMIPRYTLEAGKALGLPVTQEQLDVARAGEPLTGQFAAFKESPLWTTASYASGYILGGVTRGAGAVYNTVARVPMADAAIAGKVIPATGTTYRTALQYSDWLTTKAIPAALTVLYAGDIAARSTEGFTRFDTGSVEKTKVIIGQEAVPMILGLGSGYRIPEAILGTPRTTITSYRPTDTTQIATGGMFEQGRVGIDPAQLASGGQFRSVPSTGEVITERVVTREGGLFGEGGTSSQMKSVAATVREALDFTPQKMIERMSTRGEYTTPLEFREGAIVQSKERLYNDNPDGTPRYRQQFTQEPSAYPAEQKPEELVRLYRGEATPSGIPQKKAWYNDIESMPPEEAAKAQGMLDARGRWFTESLSDAHWYKADAGIGGGRITYVDVPRSVAEQFRVSNLPAGAEARNFPSGRASANGGMTTQEFFVSRDIASTAQPLPNQKLSLIEKVMAITTGATARMQSAYPTSPTDTRFGMGVIEYPRTTIIPSARSVSEPIAFDSRVALDIPVRPLAPEATTTSFISDITSPKFGVSVNQAKPTVKAYSTSLDEMNTFATTKTNTISAAQAIPSEQSKVMADTYARYTVIEDVGSRAGVFSFPMMASMGINSMLSRSLELQRTTATSQFITTPTTTTRSQVIDKPYTATDTRIQRNQIITPVSIILPPLWGGSGGGSMGGAKPQGRARVTDIFRYGQGIGSFGFVTPINFGAPRGRKK